MQEAARARDIELSIQRIASGDEIAAAIDMAHASRATALNVLASPLLYANRKLISDRVAQPARHQIVHDVDADVLVFEQRPRRADQEDDAEQDPLEFEPAIGGNPEHLANDSVGRRDKYRDKDQPAQRTSHGAIDCVDGAAQFQQNVQFGTSPRVPRC